jgi:hypothetical protein
MDNCSLQTRPEVLTPLKEYDVKVITFPVYMAQILQSLSFSLFGVLQKKYKTNCLSALRSYRQLHSQGFVLTQANISEANAKNTFMLLGFEFTVMDTSYTRLPRDEKLPQS